MSDQSPEQVKRYLGEPAQPVSDVPEPPIEQRTGEDRNIVEDAASAAAGAPGEDVTRLATGERGEDRPQDGEPSG